MNKNKVLNFINKLLETDSILLDYISKENLREINYLVRNMDFININHLCHIVKKTEPILYEMYDIYQTFNTNNYRFINEEVTDYNKIRSELHNYPSYKEDIATNIKSEILKINKKYNYQLFIKNITINVTFYSDNNITLFHDLLSVIYLFITKFGIKLNIFDNYNIRFLLIDFPRKLENDNISSFKNLSEHGYFNNSSGVHIKSNKELVVTRKSGIIGLLIHELIHMLGLDFCFNFNDMKHVNINNWQKFWISNNNVRDKSNMIESFIESICNTNSSYFLSIFNAIYLSSKNSLNKTLKYFKYLFYVETVYCYVQSVKVLNYFGFNNYDSFFNNTNNKIYFQNAYVFEYVILRMFLIFNFYKFLLRDMLKNDFNYRNTSKYNLNFQKRLNRKLKSLCLKNSLRIIFDNISNNLQVNGNNNVEYFLINF